MSVKTKHTLCIIFLLICILLVLFVSFIDMDSAQTALEPLAPESELTITSSREQVDAFEAQNKDFKSPYDTDVCYNITPDFIADHSDYTIFKYEECSESFVLYDNCIYSIGRCLGGSGITSMALADLNKDGQYELYYTFSWGSGLHRSQIGYFNPANKKVTVFDCSVFVSDLMLTVNEAGELCVNTVTPDYYDNESYVDFAVKAQDPIGTIALEKNRITAHIDQTILDQKPDIVQSIENSSIGGRILYKIERLLYQLGIIY